MSPSHEWAFSIAAIYNLFNIVTCGYMVAFPTINPFLTALSYLSLLRYPYQAMVIFFSHTQLNEAIAKGSGGISMKDYVVLMDLHQPPTVGGNLLVCLLFLSYFVVVGVLGLKYLNKEHR